MNSSIQWTLTLQSPSENLNVHWDSNFQSESSLWRVGVHSLTLSYIPVSMKCISQASLCKNLWKPCFGHEPKARVATTVVSWGCLSHYSFPWFVEAILVGAHKAHSCFLCLAIGFGFACTIVVVVAMFFQFCQWWHKTLNSMYNYYTSSSLKISFEISNEDGVMWPHECLIILEGARGPLFNKGNPIYMQNQGWKSIHKKYKGIMKQM
jgi:hypothetical protein